MQQVYSTCSKFTHLDNKRRSAVNFQVAALVQEDTDSTSVDDVEVASPKHSHDSNLLSTRMSL